MHLKVRQTAATAKLLCDARDDAELDEVNACSHNVKDGQTSVSSEHREHHDAVKDCSTLLPEQDLRQEAAQWAAEGDVPYTVMDRLCASIR